MALDGLPPVSGNWVSAIVTNGGAWTVGTVWLDRAAHRYAMLVEDGVVKLLNVEEAPGKADLSSASALLAQM